MKKIFFIICLLFIPTLVSAHPGNTDAYGCHTCRTNCTSWGLSYGEYHCHNPKSYSAPTYETPSTPSCPIFSLYDSLSGNCKCITGYVVDTDIFGKQTCVSGNTKCHNSYGYNSNYNSLTSKCECDYGYLMYGGECVSESSYCRDQLGYNSKYNSLHDRCECKNGYIYYNNSCIEEDDYCEEIIGDNARYNSLSDNCECDYGYEFDGSNCVDEDKSIYIPKVTCPLNSVAIGNSCYCVIGYQINSAKTACEKIPNIDNTKVETKPKSEQSCPTGQIKNSMGNCDNGWDYCKSIFGQNATYNDITKNCGCNTNYKLIDGACKLTEDKELEKQVSTSSENIKKEIICKTGHNLSLDKTYCVKIPLNAHAVESKTDVWLCDDGYEEIGNSCVLKEKFSTSTEYLKRETKAQNNILKEKESWIKKIFKFLFG